MMILAPPSADRETVMGNLGHATPLFRDDMAPALWVAALGYGIDPVGVIAQSGKETGWGAYPGQVEPEFHNTCGLKISPAQQRLFPGVTDGDNPLAHDMSASWLEGARKHAEHLLAWCGEPIMGLILDPRYETVISLIPSKGAAATWADLGGRWAPNPMYGHEIEDIMRRLSA